MNIKYNKSHINIILSIEYTCIYILTYIYTYNYTNNC